MLSDVERCLVEFYLDQKCWMNRIKFPLFFGVVERCSVFWPGAGQSFVHARAKILSWTLPPNTLTLSSPTYWTVFWSKSICEDWIQRKRKKGFDHERNRISEDDYLEVSGPQQLISNGPGVSDFEMSSQMFGEMFSRLPPLTQKRWTTLNMTQHCSIKC